MDEKATFVEPQARIQTLETLLSQSRAREEALTTQAFKDREQIALLQTRNTESSNAAADAQRKLAIIRVELESRRTEVERLGAANADLHRELESVADAASAAVDSCEGTAAPARAGCADPHARTGRRRLRGTSDLRRRLANDVSRTAATYRLPTSTTPRWRDLASGRWTTAFREGFHPASRVRACRCPGCARACR